MWLAPDAHTAATPLTGTELALWSASKRVGTQAVVSELVSEIGRHSYAGIVSIGPVGVGKSSNLNTIASYMSNRLEQQAASGTGTSSLTNESVAHLITYQGRPVKWKWMDTPGDLFTVRMRTPLPLRRTRHPACVSAAGAAQLVPQPRAVQLVLQPRDSVRCSA